MLQCMLRDYRIRFEYRGTLNRTVNTLYDRNLDMYLRRMLQRVYAS